MSDRALALAAAALLAAGATGCGADGPASDGTPRAESTRRMANRLDSLHRITADSRPPSPSRDAEPQSEGNGLAAMFGRLPILRADQILKNVQAGRFTEGVRIGESTLDTLDAYYMGAKPPILVQNKTRYLLGLAYLRAAVDSVCVRVTDAGRCHLPVLSGNVPDAAASSAGRAAELYRARLETGAGDAVDPWLLNVAEMFAGGYPDAIREEWRVPPSAFASEGNLKRFRDRAAATGVDVWGLAGGAVLEDFDGDGDLDLMASSRGEKDQIRYLENRGDGTFADRTEAAGLEGLTGGLNLKQADYDDDGDVDVLVARGGWRRLGVPNSLLRNVGDGTFADVTEEAGLLSFHPTGTAAWADYDGDGDLDLFVGNETRPDPTALGHPSLLYENEGNGTFDRRRGSEVGIEILAFVKGASWGDVDGDGRPDLYVSILDAPNRLYMNRGEGEDGTWRFEEEAEEAGVAGPKPSFGVSFVDYDNDGRQDLFVSAWGISSVDVARSYLGGGDSARAARLYRNEGDGTFEDVAAGVGLERALMTMGGNFGDLDNDGYPDLLLGTGDRDMDALFPTRAFRNDGGERFRDVTTAGGLGHLGKGSAVAIGDVDGDGDRDAYVVYGGAHPGDQFRNALYENPGHGHGWLTLRLVGEEANRFGVGARMRVVVETPEGATREVHVTAGTGASFGASSLQQEIGLGEAERVRSVRVQWPGSGTVDTYRDVEMNRVYQAREGADALEPVDVEPIDLATGAPSGPPPDSAGASSPDSAAAAGGEGS